MIDCGITDALKDSKLMLKCILCSSRRFKVSKYFSVSTWRLFVLAADIAQFLCIVAMGGNIL